MSIKIPGSLLRCTSDAAALYIRLLSIKSGQDEWILKIWGNDPQDGVSVHSSVLERMLGLSAEQCLSAIAELKSMGLLTGNDPHWQMQIESEYARVRRPVIIPKAIREKILSSDCAHCGTTEQLTIDHIVPVIEGGTDDEENLQALCRSCNARKKHHFIG